MKGLAFGLKRMFYNAVQISQVVSIEIFYLEPSLQ